MTANGNDELSALEEDFKALRIEYEKYFAGVERLEPLKERDRVKSVLRRLTTARTPNTAHRYRLQSLQASLVTYESYWNRLTRQIEQGTYHRDLFRLAHKQGEKTPAPSTTTKEVVTRAEDKKAPPAYPEALRTLYDAFVKARAETGDPRPLAIDALASTVKKQMAVIKEKFKCERVEFTVAVKDGKAILKATPR